MKANIVAKLTTTLLILGVIGTASASTISLDFNSLPSSQGWSNTGSDNNSSVSSGVLTINTIGTGFAQFDPNTAGAYYLSNAMGTNPFTISFRARVLQEEISSYDTPQSFSVTVGLNNQYFQAIIGTNALRVNNGASTNLTYAIDGTQFHDYLLSATPGLSAYTVTIDNTLVISGSSHPNSNEPNILWLGDGSSTGNIHAEITSFVFNQNSVPEPSTFILLCTGCVVLFNLKRKTSIA